MKFFIGFIEWGGVKIQNKIKKKLRIYHFKKSKEIKLKARIEINQKGFKA